MCTPVQQRVTVISLHVSAPDYTSLHIAYQCSSKVKSTCKDSGTNTGVIELIQIRVPQLHSMSRGIENIVSVNEKISRHHSEEATEETVPRDIREGRFRYQHIEKAQNQMKHQV